MFDKKVYGLLKGQIDGIAPGYNFKGSTTLAALPSTGNEAGDLYIVTNDGNAQYVWDGTQWLQIYSEIASNAQIDGLYS